MKNLGYFLKEAKTIFKIDKFSNIFSIFSIGLIFFILSLVMSGWWLSHKVVEVLKEEAEISIFYGDDLTDDRLRLLEERLKATKGIREVKLVAREESYDRMVEILDKEAKILELFDDNPFKAFIEVKINIGDIDDVLGRLETYEEIEYIRDNKNVIDKLQNIITMLTIVGALVITATGISTIVVISHIIRQGIYNNRDQINTLRLLGAPEGFIGFPFILEGLFLTLMGGLVAFILVVALSKIGLGQIGGSLLFVPLPDFSDIISYLAIFIFGLSGLLGLVGSIFGLTSAKGN